MFTAGWELNLVLLACQPPLCSVRPQIFFFFFSINRQTAPHLKFLFPHFPFLYSVFVFFLNPIVSSSTDIQPLLKVFSYFFQLAWWLQIRRQGQERQSPSEWAGLWVQHLEINQTPQIRRLNSCFPGSCASFCNLGFIATILFCSLSCLLTRLGAWKLIMNALLTAQPPSQGSAPSLLSQPLQSQASLFVNVMHHLDCTKGWQVTG